MGRAPQHRFNCLTPSFFFASSGGALSAPSATALTAASSADEQEDKPQDSRHKHYVKQDFHLWSSVSPIPTGVF